MMTSVDIDDIKQTIRSVIIPVSEYIDKQEYRYIENIAINIHNFMLCVDHALLYPTGIVVSSHVINYSANIIYLIKTIQIYKYITPYELNSVIDMIKNKDMLTYLHNQYVHDDRNLFKIYDMNSIQATYERILCKPDGIKDITLQNIISYDKQLIALNNDIANNKNTIIEIILMLHVKAYEIKPLITIKNQIMILLMISPYH